MVIRAGWKNQGALRALNRLLMWPWKRMVPSYFSELNMEEKSPGVGRYGFRQKHCPTKTTKQGVGREASSGQICVADTGSSAGSISVPPFPRFLLVLQRLEIWKPHFPNSLAARILDVIQGSLLVLLTQYKCRTGLSGKRGVSGQGIILLEQIWKGWHRSEPRVELWHE